MRSNYFCAAVMFALIFTLFQGCGKENINNNVKNLKQNNPVKEIVIENKVLQPFVGAEKKGFEGVIRLQEEKLVDLSTGETEKAEMTVNIVVRFISATRVIVNRFSYSLLNKSFTTSTSGHNWNLDDKQIRIENVGSATIEEKNGVHEFDIVLSKSIYKHLKDKEATLKVTTQVIHENKLDKLGKTFLKKMIKADKELRETVLKGDFSIFNSIKKD